MSRYVYNKHNTTWKVLAYGIYARVVFVSEILLVRCAHSFDFWYVNNSCVNTVRQQFPWSILYIQRMLKGRMTKRQRWKKWNLFISQKGYFRRHFNLFSSWGARMAKIGLKIAYTFDEWYRCRHHAAPSLEKVSSFVLLTIASDII